jgi:hypothetical protein
VLCRHAAPNRQAARARDHAPRTLPRPGAAWPDRDSIQLNRITVQMFPSNMILMVIML